MVGFKPSLGMQVSMNDEEIDCKNAEVEDLTSNKEKLKQ